MEKNIILIDVDSSVNCVALLEKGKLSEFYVEDNNTNLITGNIYKGKVVNILQGLQSAFVNIGLYRNGFLFVGETLIERRELEEKHVLPEKVDFNEGDFIMAQVTKEEIGTKGARLSTNISLPGKYLVYLPVNNFVGISNKITDPDKREWLTNLINKIKPESGGFVARTVSCNAKRSDILDEGKRLIRLYKKICDDFKEADGVQLIHSEGDLVFRAVRDMLGKSIDNVICNNEKVLKSVKESLVRSNETSVKSLELYDKKTDILDDYGVLDELDKLTKRKIGLPNGGFIVIDFGEALTSIDVNTGRYVGQNNHEDTVYMTNLEACTEIARQLRLRNIGGIIVIDFIDMLDERNKVSIVEKLKAELRNDRTKTRVLDMSGLGLVEMTRKKIRNEISTMLLDDCPYCKGDAHTSSAGFMSKKIKARLKRLFCEENFSNAIVTINGHVFDKIAGDSYFSGECECLWADKRIYLVPDETIAVEQFIVKGDNRTIINVPSSAKLLF